MCRRIQRVFYADVKVWTIYLTVVKQKFTLKLKCSESVKYFLGGKNKIQ